jgi:hypothetical protein
MIKYVSNCVIEFGELFNANGEKMGHYRKFDNGEIQMASLPSIPPHEYEVVDRRSTIFGASSKITINDRGLVSIEDFLAKKEKA